MRHGTRMGWIAVLAAGTALGCGTVMPARADTMKECSVKFQAAKKAGTLNGESWKSFRTAECDGKATLPTAAADAAPAAGTAAPAATTTAPPAVAAAAPAARPSTAASPAATGAAAGNATFPSAVSSKYSSLTPGKARMKTCVDQYKLNKTGGGNGGMKWIQKGGGYYSACIKHLKAG